jgi:dihydrofolate synthase / folylpolyglutamate synthase
MRRLCTLLGMPQNRFASIHVVGTNGKSSVTRMIAALLEAEGVRTGAYLSPHILSWRERVEIRGEPISEAAFSQALERAEQSALVADRSAGEEGPITQYELLTAAAFVAFAEARVQYAVIEAGLGGRLDATNVIPSSLTVLTSVGLDHTEWLGETVEEIAAEKVAVLRDHTTLITGPLPDQVLPVVERAVAEKHAKRPSTWRVSVAGPGLPYGPAGYQHTNADIAWSAVKQVLGWQETDVIPEGLEHVLAALSIPGRAQLVAGDPPEIFDAAHNPDGARALAAVLPDLADNQPVVCCLAVLEGKDAIGIIDGLAPACSHFVCTEIPPEAIEGSGRPGGRARPALELAALCEKAGVGAEAVSDPLQAWVRARELADGRDGVALAAGSHYLLSCIWTERPAQSS